MKRLLFAAPEGFSFAPLIALLPTVGTQQELSQLKSSFYARYEKVNADFTKHLLVAL